MAHAKKVRRSKKRRANNNMKWIFAGIAGGVALLIAALVLVSRQDDSPGQKTYDPNFEPEVTGAPRVEVVQDDVIDYGDVKLGTTVTTEYTVRNLGDEQLVVLGEPQVELVEGC